MVYHLAAQSSAAVSFRDPGGTFAANVDGHPEPAGSRARPARRPNGPWCCRWDPARNTDPSRKSAYPLTEDTPLNPLSPYGVSKVAQTLLCRQYVRSYDLPVIMTRSFSHTGPGHDTRFAFPSFARQIAAAEAGPGPCGNLDGRPFGGARFPGRPRRGAGLPPAAQGRPAGGNL